MKKIYLFSLAAVAVGMAFTSCTNNEEVLDQASMRSGLKVSIPATFADNADTRVLKLDGNTLKSEWAKDDEVFVYKNNTLDSSPLKADKSGANANLVGELNNSYSVNDELTLVYGYRSISGGIVTQFDYYSQKGTFDNVQNYDFSTATVTVKAVDGNKVETTEASFKPSQSIFKFSFIDNDGNAVNVKRLTISSDNKKLISKILNLTSNSYYSINVSLDEPYSEVWVALCMDESIAKDVITFEVEDDNRNLYEATKTATEKPINGKYYQSTIQLTKNGKNTLTVTPSTLNGETYNVTETTATATGASKKYNIYVIQNDATLTLNGVTIEEGSVGGNTFTINIEGNNVIDKLNFSKGIITFTGSGKLIIAEQGEDLTQYIGKDRPGIALADNLKLTYDGKINTIEPKGEE
ncbi:MAG: hypothetical protein E7100_09990 [Bacteroidaceae bacterium]|nr:hypothetical protein [Bacteroidaceae bacterium]